MPIGKGHLETVCRKCYGEHKPCNFFVRDVANALNELLPCKGTADDILGGAAQKWMPLAAKVASIAAENGHLVIAGMSSDELHEGKGHVAVVLPGQLHNFPRVASTNEGDGPFGKSLGDNPLTRVFPAKLVRLGKVHFYAKPTGASGSW
jgi:hypothetical protein